MPIKFRCVHCRQLLGISRGKAGQPVDCPTCGRTVRVPNLDGRAEPVSAPGMNLNDSSLIQALDALAMIGQLPSEEEGDADEVVFREEEAESEQPAAPAPAPVLLSPPLPAEPVVIALPSNAQGSQEPTNKLDPHELALLTQQSAVDALHRQFASATSRRAVLMAGLSGIAGLSAGFMAGFFLGRRSEAPAPAPQESTATAAAESSGGSKLPAVAEGGTGLAVALRGRITYRTEAGDSRADAGARVIVLPQKRVGEVRLPVAGFRAADSEADFRVAQASVRALGGDVTRVADDGSYEIRLPAAGQYHVLVLSRFQPQSSERATDAPLKNLLDAWFARPDQLLGMVRYHLGQTRYSGGEPQLWDHSFEPVV